MFDKFQQAELEDEIAAKSLWDLVQIGPIVSNLSFTHRLWTNKQLRKMNPSSFLTSM